MVSFPKMEIKNIYILKKTGPIAFLFWIERLAHSPEEEANDDVKVVIDSITYYLR